jgi:hypothetical protein
MTSVVQSSYSISVSCSGITMARLTVLVDFDALTAFYDVDFRVMLRVVGRKIGWSVSNPEVSEVIGIAYYLPYVHGSQNNSLLFASLVWLRR